MTSAVNVRSQLLITVIIIFIGVIIQCDASTSPGKVFSDKDFKSIIVLFSLKLTHYITGTHRLILVISE